MMPNQATIPFLKRTDIRRLKKEVLKGASADAAESLVLDSIRKNHGKLLLRRIDLLMRIDAKRCASLALVCQRTATRIQGVELCRIFERAIQ
jgi:hypothetical protein